ncbi:hypothetical protein [Brevibacillus porteri]|uniref:hypothetical protein n=1 Tax=Brevibacillus porteri TaxID=2126350 RepID=UPI003D26044C
MTPITLRFYDDEADEYGTAPGWLIDDKHCFYIASEDYLPNRILYWCRVKKAGDYYESDLRERPMFEGPEITAQMVRALVDKLANISGLDMMREYLNYSIYGPYFKYHEMLPEQFRSQIQGGV